MQVLNICPSHWIMSLICSRVFLPEMQVPSLTVLLTTYIGQSWEHNRWQVCNSKTEFLKHKFERLNKVLKERIVLKVDHVFFSGDTAVVEMTSNSTALNGKPFPNTYCWVMKFDSGLITEVRAYVDSVLVQQVIDENEPGMAV